MPIAGWLLLAPLALVLAAAPASADPLAETPEIVWSGPARSSLRDKASELGSAPAIYEFVRNGFEYQLYEGARRTAFDAFEAREGNDVDLASVLIAMLRSQGIAARYAVGSVAVHESELASWLQTIHPDRAFQALQHRVDTGASGASGTITFEHVWVQAHVRIDDYRGAGRAAETSCAQAGAQVQCVWVNLDPSFKLHALPDPAGLLDITDQVEFDYEAYYRADDGAYPAPPDGIERGQKGPLEIYEEQLTQYLRTTPGYEGKTLEDLIYAGPIVPLRHGILPSSLPYHVDESQGGVRSYDSVAEHDAAEDPWSNFVSFELRFPGIAELAGLQIPLSTPLSLPRLADADLTLTLESSDFADPLTTKRMVARLGGEVVQELFSIRGDTFTHAGGAVVFDETAPGVGSPFDLYVALDANNRRGNDVGPYKTIDARYRDLMMGGHYLVAVGGEESNPGRVRRAAARLLAANDQYPTVEEQAVLYLDANRNGWDASDVPLLESAEAQAALTGGLLGVARALYFARVRQDQERVWALHRSMAGISGYLGVVSTVHDVHAVDGTAFSIVPTGLLVDMKGMTTHTAYDLDAELVRSPRVDRLAGHVVASNEHEIWQEITGYEAMSTLRGIQVALGDGAELLLLDERADLYGPENLTKFGLREDFPSDDFRTRSLPIMGEEIVFFRSRSQTERVLDVMRKRLRRMDPQWHAEAWSLLIDDDPGEIERYVTYKYHGPLLDMSALAEVYRPDLYHYSNPIQFCPEYPAETNLLVLLNNLYYCFALEVESDTSIGAYLRTFNQARGFDLEDFVFREFDREQQRHLDLMEIAEIRRDVVFGDAGQSVQYLVPTTIARGELLDLSVWIRSVFDTDGSLDRTEYVIEHAHGGWVTSELPFDPFDPFQISFSNETFWENSLNATISNSIFGPSTLDPISTVSGNMYHDETDLEIKGRSGFGYLFTRTYNSNPTDTSEVGRPMGNRWSHSYDMRLIARDHGREPNSLAPHTSDGVVSSITFVDERGGEHLYGHCAETMLRVDGGSSETTGWIDVECDLGVMGAGGHTLVLGLYNNLKTWRNESTRISIDDVVIEVGEGAPPVLEAHFDTDPEGFVYRDDAFGTAEPGYADGVLSVDGGEKGGALVVEVGGVDDLTIGGMSGGWEVAFELTAASPIVLRYRFQLDMSEGYEPGEWSEPRLAFDGVEVGGARLEQWNVVAPRGEFDELDLSEAAAGRYILRFRNGTEYVFGDADLGIVGASARLLEMRDFLGNTLSFHYADGRLTRVTDDLGVASRTGLELEYDPEGRLERVTDWGSRSWRYEYDDRGNLTTVWNPLGELTRYVYDDDEPLLVGIVEDLDGDGSEEVRTTFDYYENGRALENRDAYGVGEQLEYDLFRKRTRIKDPRGFVTKHHYDEHGALVKLVGPDAGIQSFESQADGRRYRKTTSMGFETRYSYCKARTTDGCASDTGGNVTLERDALGNMVEYDYETRLHDVVTRVRRKDGAEQLLQYYETDDPALGAVRGMLARVTMSDLGGRTNVDLARYQYNPDGTLERQVEFIDPDDTSRTRTTLFQYDPSGLDLLTVTVRGSDGNESSTSYEYDALGRRIKASTRRRSSPSDPTPVLLEARFRYDALDRLVWEMDAAGHQRETDYYPNGEVKERRSVAPLPDGSSETRVVARYVYDDANRLVAEHDLHGATTTTRYDEAGNILTVTGPTGTTVSHGYDAVGNRIEVQDGNGHRTMYRYDADGRLLALTDAGGHVTTYVYDAIGREIQRVDPLGHTTRREYDAMGRVTKEIDANGVADASRLNSFGATLYREYDELGREVLQVDAEDAATRFAYDLLGNRTRVVDAEGQVSVFVYDDLGRLVETMGAGDTTATRFEYDELGNLIRQIDRAGHVVEYTYDVLNRLVSTELPASNRIFEYRYDPHGNLASVVTPDIATSYGYDDKNRMTSMTDERLGKSLHFRYDAADRLVEKTDYQGDETHYLYDATGRLISERNARHLQVTYRYDPVGRPLERALSNGASTRFQWDAAGRLVEQRDLTADGTLVTHATYVRDPVGNVLSRIDASGESIYVYDRSHRLLNADLPGVDHDRAYTYDGVGNRIAESTALGTRTYAYRPGNRLDSIRSDLSTTVERFGYDANGAAVWKQAGPSDQEMATVYALVRDDLGLVRSVWGAEIPTNHYSYDANGSRVGRRDSGGDQLFHLEGKSIEAIYGPDPDWLYASFMRGALIDEVVSGYHYDDLGREQQFTYHHDPVTSVVALSGHAGTIEETTTFAPFGEELATTGASPNTLRYTGRERDPDTGLYYYRARYYDPSIGRFLSEDPIGFQGGVNFYAYAANNPVRLNDPSGECPAFGLVCAGLAIGAAGAISMSVAATVATIHAEATGADRVEVREQNAKLLDAATVVGSVSLAPIVAGGGALAARSTFGFVLAEPLLATEVFNGLLIGGATEAVAPGFKHPSPTVVAFASGAVAEMVVRGSLEAASRFAQPDQGYPGTPASFQPSFSGHLSSDLLLGVYCSPKCN